ALWLDGCADRLDHAAIHPDAILRGEALAESFAGNSHAVEIEAVLEFPQDGADAARREEVLHIVLVADGLHGGEDGRRVGEFVEALEIELRADASRDGREMHDTVR